MTTPPKTAETPLQMTEEIRHKARKRLEFIETMLEQQTLDLARLNQDLEAREEYLKEIMENMLDMLVVIDPHGFILLVNRAVLHLLGYAEDELLGKPHDLLLADDSRMSSAAWWARLIQEGRVKDVELTYRSKGGEGIPVSFGGGVIYETVPIETPDSAGTAVSSGAPSEKKMKCVVGVVKDIRAFKTLLEKEKEAARAIAVAEAERRRAHELEKAYRTLQETQDKLIHSGKMAVLGQFGASVALELNQALTGIQGFVQIILAETPGTDARFSDLKTVEMQAGRMKKIVDNILGFARVSKFTPAPVRVSDPLSDAIALVSSQLLDHHITVVKMWPPDLPLIQGDAHQLQQVFLNCLSNARDAIIQMPGEPGGEIKISIEKNDHGLQVCIHDNGAGMDAGQLSRLFQPFYTTKPSGKGVGLGLSLCREIIAAHQGSLEIESEEGRGTRVLIRLPLAISPVTPVT